MTIKNFITLLCLLVSLPFLAQKKDKKTDEKPAVAPTATPKPAADTTKPKKPAIPTITDKIKSARKIDGMLTVYQDTLTGSLQLYIKKNQLDKEYIYQSFSISGPNALFLNQGMHRSNIIFVIKKAYDKLELSEINTNLYYDPTNPVSKAANADIPEAVFLSEKIVAHDSTGYLIAADGLFLSEKLDPIKPVTVPGLPPGAIFNLGTLNTAKSKYHKVRSFPNNTDIIVDLAYDNPTPLNGGDQAITDARYVRVRMQHSFMEVPKNDFRPRRDDPRIGYFTEQVNDQTTIKPTNYHDIIHRWYLKKKDPTAAMSDVLQPVTYWVENTTPYEYREIVKAAGLRWNEAFAKAGYNNAIDMQIMADTATWDPADVRYNVIRWVASANPTYGAIGPSFVNPRTGQILGADITVEWYSGSASPIFDELVNGSAQAAFGHTQHHNCTLANELKAQFLAGTTIAEIANADTAQLKQIHKEFLYYLILHEMGHTLGLNHNMKASQMLSPSQLHNRSITEAKGLIASVMDYPAINIAADRSKQGQYYTTKPGPYDHWAIEYGYREFDPATEEAELTKILKRSTEPDLIFGNDADDMRSPGKAIDPRVQVNDLSSDALAHAEERFALVNNIMPKLKAKYSKDNQSYQELRSRFGTLMGQRMNMLSAVSRYIGGLQIDRTYGGQPAPAKPYTPVSKVYQKKAMEIISKHAFAPNAWDADKDLYPYLQSQRRGFGFFSSTEDPKLNSNYLNLQIGGALAHILHPSTLQRITNTTSYGNEYPLAEVFADLNKAIFNADISSKVLAHRQYLQTAYTKQLITIADKTTPYDDLAKATARATLRKIRTMLATATSPDEPSRIHRSNLQFLIEDALTVK
jgi:hypothetical protein